MKAKKLIALVLSVMIVFAALPTFALFTASATEPVVKTVYVSSSGNDTTGDGTSANPYDTISKAEAVIEADSADAGEVIMLTDMNFTSAPHTKMITIKGDTGAENLVQTGSITSANGPTTFKEFNVNDTFKNITDGNEVIFDNVSVSGGTKGMFYFGNSDSSITTDNYITIDGLGSGVNAGVNVRIGPGTRQGTMNSDLNVVVNSGYFYQFWVHEGTYNGDFNFTFNGGYLYGSDPFLDPYNISATTYNGAYQVILNNGFSGTMAPSISTLTAAGGKWLMYCDNSGGMLSTTSTPGTFAVSEGYIATATNRSTSTEYESSNGTLTVPAGTYDVTYEAAPSDADTFYVSSSGSNANNGLTSATPFATIAQAETALEASSALSGQIIMLTDMTFTSAAHTKMMTIKGATGAENLTNTGSVVSVNGPTTFKDFNINNTFNHVTNGNEVVYDNITFDTSRGNFYLGNLDGSVTAPNNITINGLGQSAWHGPNFRIGPQTRAGVMNGDLNITVNSGYFNQFWVHEGTYNGNVSYTINGGTVYGGDPFIDPYAINNHVYNGAYQVILNNGITSDEISPTVKNNVTATGGKWLMYCDNSGGMLSISSTPGTFNITGSSSAIATNTSTGVRYSSSNGTLTVPAGEYNVSFGYAVNNTSTFYVSENGNDSNTGLSPATAFATINQAEGWFNYSTAATKTIIVSGEVAFDGGVAHEDMITIRGDGTASLVYDTTGQYNSQIFGHIAIKGPTTIENITLDDTKLVSNGYELVLGEGVQPGAEESNDGYYYVGNLDNSASSTKAENVTINSFNSDLWHGAFVRIGAFGDDSDRAMGDVNITINGGNFRRIEFWQAVINGNVNFIINGGSVNTVEGSAYSNSVHDNTVFNGAVQFIMNKSMDDRFLGDDFDDIDAADGVWYVYCSDTAGGVLAPTETAGNYAISGAAYAKAINRSTGEVIYSYEGELDLSGEDGTYDVTLYDSIHFGDVNCDGEINVVDLVLEKKIIAAIEDEEEVDYIWAADVDEDLDMAASDITALINHLIGRETISWASSSPITLISGADLTFGGAESAATSMKSTISGASDTVKNQSGTKIYVSENGNDSNSGTSSSAPVKTIAKVNTLTSNGSIVLFERGGVYRTDVALDLKSNVKVGAYGTGAKPVISGSIKNYAESTVWTSTDGCIWQTNIGEDHIGGVVFNDGESIGNWKNDIKSLVSNGDYYYDTTEGILYLFLDQHKPSAYFDSIDISTTPHLIYETKASPVSNVKIENIEFSHTSLTMLDFHQCSSITITGCKFSWGGGATDSKGVRCGNGIQFWISIDTASITNCHFYQIYDAAFTVQGHSDDKNNYRNVTFQNNLVEYCSYNLEFWCGNDDSSVNDGYQATAIMNDISVSNNIFRYSGYGFGKQRSATYSQAYILAYDFDPDRIMTFGLTISNNIFDCARSYYFNAKNAYDDITFSGNTYYQSSDCVYPIVWDDSDSSDDVIPTNATQFATEIHSVDSTATVNWITR